MMISISEKGGAEVTSQSTVGPLAAASSLTSQRASPIMIDFLYLTYNRKDFTAASLKALKQNTNWSLVRKFSVYDDCSIDGTRELVEDFLDSLRELDGGGPICSLTVGKFGGPVSVMAEFLREKSDLDLFCKLDSDVIVPPGWLDSCLAVMEQNPMIDLLGIEPWHSRTPSPWSNGVRSDLDQDKHLTAWTQGKLGAAKCDSIGGIGLMRRKAWEGRSSMVVHGPNGVGGFTDWQVQNRDVVKGWICPPLKLFLLDRLPMEPWKSLSAGYEAKNWQRPWTRYSVESTELWSWWLPRD